MRPNSWIAIALASTMLACSAPAPPVSVARALNEDPLEISINSGRRLFDLETFGGNGRTCRTCHLPESGAINPEQIQVLAATDPGAAIFRSIDSDDGIGDSYSLLLRDATMRIPRPLPPNVIMLDDPAAREVVVRRGVPTVNNIALDPVLMYDGREPDLQSQAIGAVHTHNQPTREPTAEEAEDLARFQEKQFSSPHLLAFSHGGPAPTLPEGVTESERRGRRFFEETETGFCVQCHGGPMLNTINRFNFFQPPGERFASNFSAELNKLGRPVHTYQFTMPDGSVRLMITPDPGRALVTGNPCFTVGAGCFTSPILAFPVFKIPTLWGVKDTAPYFHDSSAKTLEELMDHYQIFFAITAEFLQDPRLFLSNQDKQDIIAFLRLL